MYRNILLCTDGSPDADVATEYAIWLGARLRARLRVLYVTDVRLLEGPWLADFSGAIGAQPYPALVPRIQQLQKQKAETLLAAVQQRCEQHHVECETRHETGSLVRAVLDLERDADLVVLGQHGEHAQWSGDMLGSSVERVVRASVRPSLVTPDEFREIKGLLVAYDGSQESAKALQAGIELARGLDAEMRIVTVCRTHDEERGRGVLQQAHQQAVDAQLIAHAQLLHGDPETEILNERLKTGADLIVMGAYGHTRIREFVLGSTTSHVIRKSTVPVLLARG